jgi:hypothetical protein
MGREGENERALFKIGGSKELGLDIARDGCGKVSEARLRG